jgi:DNA-binding MarR family transcriptional regulator
MHNYAFRTKRAFHSTLRVIKEHLAPDAEDLLTPARFDMMFAIVRCSRFVYPQAYLRHLLGVSSVTISRMLRRMEELGLIVRYRDERDRRIKVARLTELGSSLLRRLKRTVIRKHVMHRELEEAIQITPRKRARAVIDEMIEHASAIAASFDDPAGDMLDFASQLTE